MCAYVCASSSMSEPHPFARIRACKHDSDCDEDDDNRRLRRLCEMKCSLGICVSCCCGCCCWCSCSCCVCNVAMCSAVTLCVFSACSATARRFYWICKCFTIPLPRGICIRMLSRRRRRRCPSSAWCPNVWRRQLSSKMTLRPSSQQTTPTRRSEMRANKQSVIIKF